MFRLVLSVPLLALVVLGAQSLDDARPHPPVAASPVSAVADTLDLEHRVEAGRTLIFSLPEVHAGETVSEYLPLRVPPMSWLQGRSFMWQTRIEDTGQHELLFLARFEEAPEDTVRVGVDVVQ